MTTQSDGIYEEYTNPLTFADFNKFTTLFDPLPLDSTYRLYPNTVVLEIVERSTILTEE